jgi:hypothetical protein
MATIFGVFADFRLLLIFTPEYQAVILVKSDNFLSIFFSKMILLNHSIDPRLDPTTLSALLSLSLPSQLVDVELTKRDCFWTWL